MVVQRLEVNFDEKKPNDIRNEDNRLGIFVLCCNGAYSNLHVIMEAMIEHYAKHIAG